MQHLSSKSMKKASRGWLLRAYGLGIWSLHSAPFAWNVTFLMYYRKQLRDVVGFTREVPGTNLWDTCVYGFWMRAHPRLEFFEADSNYRHMSKEEKSVLATACSVQNFAAGDVT